MGELIWRVLVQDANEDANYDEVEVKAESIGTAARKAIVKAKLHAQEPRVTRAEIIAEV